MNTLCNTLKIDIDCANNDSSVVITRIVQTNEVFAIECHYDAFLRFGVCQYVFIRDCLA